PHWPGLFVTGRLSQMDVQKVKRAIKIQTDKHAAEESIKKAKADIADFKRKKVSWISHGTIISSKELTSKLPQPQKTACLLIGKIVDTEIERITTDILRIIEDFSPKKDE